jgi:tetratricopeptide (TPR) repeat protein
LIHSKNSKWKIAWLLFPMIFVLAVGGALADDNKQKAKKHFKIAEQHYKLGRFKEALKEYSKAYELAPLAGFLFNIGQCHRLLGNHERAVFFYEGYLREKPNAKNRKAVLKLIKESKKELNKELAEQKRIEAEKHKTEEARRRAELLKKERDAEREKAREKERMLALERDRLAALAEARRKEQEKPPAFYETWWFWTIVGSVVAAAAGGTVYALSSGGDTVLPSGNLGTLDLRGL